MNISDHLKLQVEKFAEFNVVPEIDEGFWLGEMMNHQIYDSFPYSGEKNKWVVVIEIKNEDVKYIPSNPDYLINEDEPYKILKMDWFGPSSIPTPTKLLGLVLDRQIDVSEWVHFK